MAQTFNLTAQINLRGPANIKPIVANIKKQLGSINANVNIKLDSKAGRNIDVVNNKLKALNATLIQASRNSQNLASSLASIGAAAQSLNSLNKVNSNLSKITNNVNSSSKALKQASSEMENFGRQSFLALKRFAAISVVTAGIYGLLRAITDGARAFIVFDKELIRLQQITKAGSVGIKDLENEIVRLSVSLGVSGESLTQVAVTLAQAGLTASQTKQALEALAKTELAPSFEDIKETTEGAIAAMRQFGISTAELEGALGSINAVAAAFAVESGDIIAAIQRAGGVFASASKGVSEGTDALNEFIAVFTSVRATTRESAETIATGLRTIFTRIQRGSTIKFLREFGIELQDSEGKFVGAYEAIRRLSEGLQSIDTRDIRFSQIVEELGGFRQISKVIPLIQQFGDAQNALRVAQQGQGSLSDAQIKAQQSLANQLARVRNEFLALIKSIGQTQTFQALFKIVLGLTSSLIKLTSVFKPLLPLLAVLGAIKGGGAIAKFGKGFFGSFKKGGGASAAGSTLGQTVTGSSPSTTASPLDAAALNAMTQAVTANSGALNSSTTALNNLITPLQTLTTSISGVGASLTTAISPLFQFIFDLNYSIRSLDSSVQALTLKIDNIGGGGTTLNGGGKVLGFARGGVVPGSGNRDTVPAMLQPGEFVIRKKAVETIGAENLHSMNKYGSGGSVSSGSSGQHRQKFAKGGLAQLANLSPGMKGRTNIPEAIKNNDKLQDQDIISNQIIRTQISKKDIEKMVTGGSNSFKKTIEGIRTDQYSDQFYQSGLGFAFEDWVFQNMKGLGLSGKYEKAPTKNYPVDLIPIGNAAPVEIKYKNESEPDPFVLNKHFRYLLDTDGWKSSGFTRNIDTNVGIGNIRVIELKDGTKDELYYPNGVKEETKQKRKDRAEKRIAPFYQSQANIQQFLDGGWVKRMQQQKKFSLVNAATQLEYWIDKIYAGTEEVGFSPSFKGGKNPSEEIDFKELQERLAAIDEFLNAPVSSAKAKKSGLKSAGGYEPEELLDAVKLYQGGSGPLTRAMANQDFLFIDRKEQYDTEDVVARLQAASQYQTRKKLYSGLGKSQFYETLKDTGLSEDDVSDQNKVKSIVGKTIDFPTFLSTSYKKDVATAFVGDPGAMMEISTAKSKTTGIDVNKAKMTSDSGKPTARRLPGIDKIPKEKLFKYDDEDEFILPPNTAFKVQKASTNKIRAKSEDDEEWDIIMGTGGDGQTPLMDLAVQMLATGGEAQKVADKLGLGKPLADSWWTGNFAGQDVLFDWGSPTRAYKTSDGSKIDIDQNLRKPLRERAQREWLAFAEQRAKEARASKTQLSAEQQDKINEATSSLLTSAASLAQQKEKQKAEDYIRRTEKFTGDFEPTSVGSSAFRRGKTAQERKDYYAKRVKGYMVGGVAEDTGISPNLQQLLDRIAAVGGPKTATELAGYPSGSMNIRKVLNKNSLLAGKNIQQAEAIVAKAEEAYKKKQAANQSAIDASNEFALVGAYPIGYSKDYGPENIGGLSTFFTARGLPPKYQQEIDEIAADVRDLPSRAAERIQMKNIFGAGTKLAFDLDDTLITDADIFKPGSSADPDIPAYSDVDRVTEALKNAKLTRLGEVLRSKLTETPQLLEDIRILTARPQNNAAAIATRLSQLGILISPNKITGVSGAGNKVDNLSEFETLVDDRLATIEQVTRAGKRAIPYEPIRGYDPTSPSAKKAAQVIEGYAIEGLMERLGVPIVEDDANRAIDYPDGLGAKASIWGVNPNVPTDVKRTMDGDAFGRFRAEIERYYSSNAQRFATGGSVQDTVPALLTPGEFVINKKAAATIGYGKLNKLNKADKLKGYNKGGIVGGIQSFADGGDVRGTQEWADIVRQISAVSNAGATMADWLKGLEDIENDLKAAGKIDLAAQVKLVAASLAAADPDSLVESLTSSSSGRKILEEGGAAGDETSVILDRLADAIERNIKVQELFASSAEEAGVSVQKFTKDVKSQILDKSLANINNRKQSRSSLRTEFAKARLLDFSDPAKVDKQREALKTSLGNLISDPAQLNKAVNDLITGAQNGSLSLQDVAATSAEVAFALNSSIDRQEALNAATTELEDTLGGLTDAARATVDELESFEYGKSGQATKDFGFLGGLNPGAALQFKNSPRGAKLLQTAQNFQNLGFDGLEEQLSKLPGPVGDAVKAIGGLPGVLAAVSSVIGSEILPQLSKALGMGDSEIMAGVGGALAEGGSMAISMGTLGQQLAGPIGGMIGTIGGAVAGAIKGFVTGFETKALENALKRLGEQTEKISEAFANLAKNATQDNLNIVRKENQGLVTNIQKLQELGEISSASRAADATVYGTLAGLGTLLAGAGLFAAGAGLTAVGGAASATGVGAVGGIPAVAAGTGLMSIGTGLMYAAPAAAAAGAAYGGFLQDYSDLDDEAYKASLDAAQSYIDGLTRLAERKISFLSVEALDQDISDYEDFTKQLNERIKRGEITPANAEIERANFNAEFGRTRSVAIQEAQRSALLRSGFNIDENQSINDFTQNNAAASSVAQQAANDAFIQLARAEINRQFGSNTEAARKRERDLGSEGLLRRGQEIAGINDYQAKAAQRLANISKELSIETEKLYEAYDRALAGIRRFTDGIDELIKSSDQSAGFLTGQAQIGPVDRTNENMLSNMSAYSAAELEPVIESVVNASGGTAEAQKLGDAIRANQVISQQLPDILRDAETGDISGVTSQLEEALRGAGISDETAGALSREIGTELESRTGDRVGGVGFGEILENFPAFQQALQSTQKAQEVGVAVLKAQNDALDKVNQQANKFAEQLRKSAEWLRTADTIRLEGALNLQRALGQIPTLDQLNEPFETEIRSLSGINSSDPVLIANSIRANNEAQKEARQRQKTALANNNQAGVDKATADLARLSNASNDAYQALEKLATTGTEAANILTKIEEERQLGRNTIDFVRKISTQSGEEAVEMQRSFDAFNRTLDGTLNFGNVRERRLAYQGMDTILPLLRGSEAGRQAEADFTINMLRGQGVNVDQEFGNTGSSLRDLVLAGTTGTDANTTALIKKYDEAIAKQEEAARQLAYLNEEAAYLETLPTIAVILNDLNQRLPAIIAAALQQGNPGQPRDPMQGVPAPMSLDVAVQEGQGFMDAQRARRAAELQAREAEAAAEAERRAAAPAVPRPVAVAPAGAAAAPARADAPAGAAAVVNPAIFDRLAATLPQIDMQMLNVINSMTVLSNGVIKLDATIALLQTELARDNGFGQSVTNFTETTRTFGGHVDTFTRKIDTFGTYVDKLDKAVGSLSNATITMGGSYTVDVRVSGAAAFTAIEDKTKDLINKEIDLAMGELITRINRATGFNLDLNRRT